MRSRTALTVALVAATALGSVSPAMAAKAKPKPKPITGGFTATANPDPTSNNPGVDTGTCNPTTPTARVTHTFKVPAAGSLHVNVNNKLDWSADLRDTGGVLTDSDGSLPNDPEMLDAFFKKPTTVTIGVCNFAGEPQINVSYTFTFK